MDRAPISFPTSYCRWCYYPRGGTYKYWDVCPICKSFWNRKPYPTFERPPR